MRKERKGEYLRDRSVTRHITDALKDKIKGAATTTDSDVIITGWWWPVGDVESLPFLEALRQMKADVALTRYVYPHNASSLFEGCW